MSQFKQWVQAYSFKNRGLSCILVIDYTNIVEFIPLPLLGNLQRKYMPFFNLRQLIKTNYFWNPDYLWKKFTCNSRPSPLSLTNISVKHLFWEFGLKKAYSDDFIGVFELNTHLTLQPAGGFTLNIILLPWPNTPPWILVIKTKTLPDISRRSSYLFWIASPCSISLQQRQFEQFSTWLGGRSIWLYSFSSLLCRRI